MKTVRDDRSKFWIGSVRILLPVALNRALTKAGAITEVLGSPAPPKNGVFYEESSFHERLHFQTVKPKLYQVSTQNN